MPAWRSPHDTNPHYHLGKKDALLGAIGLSVVAFVLQLLGAWYTGSLALLGDSAHLLTDLFSLFLSLAAVLLAAKPTTTGRSFGLYRLEVLATFVNGVLLLAVSLALAWESVARLWHPEPVKAEPMIVVAFLGLVSNLLAAWLLHRASQGSDLELHHHHGHGHDHGHDRNHAHDHEHEHAHDHGHGGAHLHEDRNLRAALLHVWSDALGSLAVIVGGVVMLLAHVDWVDAAVSLMLSLWILRWSWGVILESGHVLLESTPKHVQCDRVKAKLRELDARVEGVDDLHVWELTSRMYAATAEVRVREMSLEQAETLRQQMHRLLHDQFGIAHVVLAIRPDEIVKSAP